MKDYLITIAPKSVSNILTHKNSRIINMNYTGVIFMGRKVQQAPSIFYYIILYAICLCSGSGRWRL